MLPQHQHAKTGRFSQDRAQNEAAAWKVDPYEGYTGKGKSKLSASAHASRWMKAKKAASTKAAGGKGGGAGHPFYGNQYT